MVLSRKKIAMILLAVLFFGGMMGRYLRRAEKREFSDFRVYHFTARMINARADIYVPTDATGSTFKYSPFFAFAVSPLGHLPIKGAAALFFTLNFLATIALFRLSHKLCREEKPPPSAVGIIYFLSALFLSRFILIVWDSGQVPILMCLLVTLGVYAQTRRKDVLAGILFALAILIKYTPAIFVFYFLLRKQYRCVLATTVALVGFLMLPAVSVGWHQNTQYLLSWIPHIITSSLDAGSYSDFKNQSIYSMVIRLLSDTTYGLNIMNLTFEQAQRVGYGIAGGLYLLALFPRNIPGGLRIDVALLFSFLALFNPNGWMTNFVAMAFPYVFLLNYLVRVRGKDVFVLACVALSFPLTSWMSQDMVGNFLENLAAENSSVTWGALLLVAALVKLKFGKSQV